MGMIQSVFSGLASVFGHNGSTLKDTVEVFVENREAASARASAVRQDTLHQYGAEFAVPRKGGFDRFMDGVNRLPRPALALGTLGLFVAAMVDPLWFASRMQGIALVPEPLWWLLGAIVSFYFGARHQVKSQDFQRSITQTMGRVPKVVDNIRIIAAMRAGSVGAADTGTDAKLAVKVSDVSDNAALRDWQNEMRP